MRSIAAQSLLALFFAACGIAEPIAKPEAIPQQLTNNAPFSGAVYIVSPNGEQVVAQGGTNYCPSTASVSCANENHPSWCCPAGYACAAPANSNGLIGCCPAGNTCGGVVNVQQVTTVTVYPQQQTAVVYANPTENDHNEPNQAAGGFCATITMDGPGLPRAEEGNCGTILIVAGAPGLKVFGVGATFVAILLHFALGRMFNR